MKASEWKSFQTPLFDEIQRFYAKYNSSRKEDGEGPRGDCGVEEEAVADDDDESSCTSTCGESTCISSNDEEGMVFQYALDSNRLKVISFHFSFSE